MQSYKAEINANDGNNHLPSAIFVQSCAYVMIVNVCAYMTSTTTITATAAVASSTTATSYVCAMCIACYNDVVAAIAAVCDAFNEFSVLPVAKILYCFVHFTAQKTPIAFCNYIAAAKRYVIFYFAGIAQ